MQTLLIASLILLLCAFTDTTGKPKRDNVTLATPIVAVPSGHWEGIDGVWSTFEIRVGTPATVYRVLPITSWQETWVVYGAAKGICNASVGVASDCQEKRGGVFDSAKSTSWVQAEQYELSLDSALGYSGVGQYGFDTVGLGFTNSTGLTMKHQIVSEIVSNTWWFGILGLGFRSTNFTGYGNPQASFADTLFSNGSISSMSWSYTAGAYYRLKGVFGSLIFGGYDASRFKPNDVIFTMTGDNMRDIVVTIRSITSTADLGTTTLMSSPTFAFIDSSVPELWLPVPVCQEFEKAFNLVLDNSTGLYLMNSSTHASLLSLNPNITVTLSNQKVGGSTMSIVLPYSAFDVNVTSPILVNRTSFYFPIRRGEDETQYTLGRTFLQEAYVTAHYETRTFNVSQCVFEDNMTSHVIALPPLLGVSPNSNITTSKPRTSTKSHLSRGIIAGIAISSAAVVCLIILILFLLIRKRRQNDQPDQTRESDISEINSRNLNMEQPKIGVAIEEAENYAASPRSAGSELRRGFGSGNEILRPVTMASSLTTTTGLSPSSPLTARGSKFEEHLADM